MLDTDRQYPHYDQVRDDFVRQLEKFFEFLREEGLEDPNPDQVELTYVNHIPAAITRDSLSPLEHSLRFWAGIPSEARIPDPELVSLQTQFAIREGQDFLGRLYIQLQSRFLTRDNSPVYHLQLIARGAPIAEQPGLSGVLAFLDQGHVWIVRTFTDITTNRHHNKGDACRMETSPVAGIRPAQGGLIESSLKEAQVGTTATRSLLIDEIMRPVKLPLVKLPLRNTSLQFTVPSQEPKWFYPTLSCFQELLQLPEGWDSYDAYIITDAAIAGAAEILVRLQLPLETSPPSVVPGSSGSVQLEWHEGGVDVEIHISPTGSVTAFLSDATGEYEFETISQEEMARLGQTLSRMAS